MIKHFRALYGKTLENDKLSRTHKTLLIAFNVILIIFAVVTCVVYTRIVNEKQKNLRVESFVSTIESMKHVTINYIDTEKGYTENWAHYITLNKMTLDRALSYIRDVNTNSERYVHFVDMQTYEAYSAYYSGDNNIAHCYEQISKSTDETDRIFMKNMELMFSGEGSDASILGKYRDDITLTNVVSVGTKVTLKNTDGTDKDYLLLRLIPVESMRKAWVFPMSFRSAEIGIITNTGVYVIQSASMKSQTFIDFIRSYNYPDDYNKVNEFASELSSNENGIVTYNDSKGKPYYWYYSQFDEESGIDILGAIDCDALNTSEQNWFVVAIICGVLILLIIIDGTHILMINRQLRITAKVAEEASSAKTRFLSSMSHDIRTPMNAVVGMTEIAKKNLNDPQYVSACLDKVTLAGNHLITLINDILDISKVESGKMRLETAPVNIDKLMNNITDIIRPQLANKSIKFDCHIHDIPFNCIMADNLRLTQIYMNLLSNAYKYTKDKGHIELELYEELENCCNDCVRLVYRLKDNGIGMSEKFMSTMYDSFERAESSTISKIQGSGLGLAIVKQFTDMMGGTIDCASEEGKGTEFIVRIEFPIASNSDNKSDIHGSDAEYTKEEFDGMRLLVAEDNDLNYEIVQTMLEDYGIICERAENGSECVDMLTSSPDDYYDMVLMDVQMPVMNGREAAKIIRKSEVPYVRDIKIVAVTADAFAEDIQACLDAGMNYHVSKPIDIKNLLGILRHERNERK